jgi:hypothetical protein
MIRHPNKGKTPFFGGRVQVVTGSRFSVMGRLFLVIVDGNDRDGGDGRKHGSEHDDDEPCGSVCGLWRGLGDPHGVDKGVRDELDDLHVSF